MPCCCSGTALLLAQCPSLLTSDMLLLWNHFIRQSSLCYCHIEVLVVQQSSVIAYDSGNEAEEARQQNNRQAGYTAACRHRSQYCILNFNKS